MVDPFSGGIVPQIIQNQQGLQQLQMNRQQMEQQSNLMKQEQQADELLSQFQQGGGRDFGLVQKAVLLSPTKAQNVLATIGIADKTQKTQAAADIITLRSSLGNPETFRRAVAQRVQAIKDRGGDPTDTIGLVSLYEQGGPEAVDRELGFVGAALANEGYIQPELLGIRTTEPMSQYQAASVDLRKQELELKKLETKEKVIERSLMRETNELKKQELQQKLDAAKSEKVNAERDKNASLEQSYFSIDNMLNTVARIENDPKLDSVVGTVQGRMDAYVDDEAAATIRLIENLGSQAFMAMIPGLKGMGALSNAEGDKLGASLQNLSRVTSEKAFRANLNEVKRLMGKSRQFLADKYGKPVTAPDVPAAQQGSEASIDDLLMKYGG